jgi:NADH-quinone oxidoreductase subunit J
MSALLLASALVAVASTIEVVLQRRAVHALLYLIVSFFALAAAMLALGAAFAAALEVVVYAGAVLVLFVFIIMMIKPQGPSWRARIWIGPVALSALLLAELAYAIAAEPKLLAASASLAAAAVSPKELGIALFGPYALCAEIAAFLLLAGLVGAYHIGRRGADSRPGGGAR